jgi:hypothetical protein
MSNTPQDSVTRQRKFVGDECLVLSINDLLKQRTFIPGRCKRSKLRWVENGVVVGALSAESDLRDHSHAYVVLQYWVEREQVCTTVKILTTCPYFGGVRWWFQCPITGARAAHLYLPPDSMFFASRTAHGITYLSCRRSGSPARAARRISRMIARATI